MRRAASAKPHNRSGIWYLVRRVPKAFSHLDDRGMVKLSTEIRVADDPRAIRATPAVRQLDFELHTYWRGLRDGQAGEARRRFEDAQRRAKALRLDYRTADEMAAGSQVDEVLRRVQLLLDRGTVEDEAEYAAVMGGEARPSIKLSGLYEEFEALMAPSLGEHSPNQRKKWGLKYKRAIKAFKDKVGDKELVALTRSDAVEFRKAWQERVANEGIDIGTANKSMGHVGTMLGTIEMTHQLGIKPIFEKIRIAGEVKRQRAAFTAEWVQKHILADGALDGLNAEARAIVWICADTGMRPVEVANLLPESIHVGAAIPYVTVQAIDRKLKTVQSERAIPLVGAALAAMKLFPNGFPRYHDKSDSLSAVVNKFLDDHKLLPTSKHSNYSFRHCFEDRLTAVEAPEKLIAAMMGHKYARPKYGAGPSLKQKQEWLQKIAFTPPAQFGPLS